MCACVSMTTKVSDWMRTSKGTAPSEGNFRQGTSKNGSYEGLLREGLFLGTDGEPFSFKDPLGEASLLGDKCWKLKFSDKKQVQNFKFKEHKNTTQRPSLVSNPGLSGSIFDYRV